MFFQQIEEMELKERQIIAAAASVARAAEYEVLSKVLREMGKNADFRKIMDNATLEDKQKVIDVLWKCALETERSRGTHS